MERTETRGTVSVSAQSILVHPKGDPNEAHHTDIAMAGLFNAHVATINSERLAIWQRYNAMLLANAIVFGFLARQGSLKTLEVLFGTLFGVVLCVCWLVLTVSAWNLFNLWYTNARRFSWPKLDEGANPLEVAVPWYQGTTGGWIYRIAIITIFLFMLGYLFLLFHHLLQ
jgi:hypothetical protein